MYTNKPEIAFRFNKVDRKLFDKIQKEHWRTIEKEYKKLKQRCQKKIFVPVEATQKNWITARVNLHATESVMRLLYLTEAFCETSKKFNGAASAVLLKGMVEIPLHLGYMFWIISENHSFEKVRKELSKIAFGNRDKDTGLTSTGKVTGREMYDKADEMIEKIHKNSSEKSTIKIFKTLYKESNATGHHNFEARMFSGLYNNDTWEAKDRKELFQFLTNKIFQLFLHSSATLGMTSIFLRGIDHHLEHLPDEIKKQ